MRFVLFVFGVVVGVAATLGYVVYFSAAPSGHATQAPPAEAAIHAPITVTLGEQFLTGVVKRAAVEAPQGVDVPASDLRAELRDGNIVLHGSVEVLGRGTPGTAILRPTLADGRLKIEVVESNLGTLPLGPIEKVLEDQINQRIGSLLAGMPVTFTGVTVEPRGLTLTCQVDLDQLAGPPRT